MKTSAKRCQSFMGMMNVKVIKDKSEINGAINIWLGKVGKLRLEFEHDVSPSVRTALLSSMIRR